MAPSAPRTSITASFGTSASNCTLVAASVQGAASIAASASATRHAAHDRLPERDRLGSGRDQQLHRRALGDGLADRGIGLGDRVHRDGGRVDRAGLVGDLEAQVAQDRLGLDRCLPLDRLRDRDLRSGSDTEVPAGRSGDGARARTTRMRSQTPRPRRFCDATARAAVESGTAAAAAARAVTREPSTCVSASERRRDRRRGRRHHDGALCTGRGGGEGGLDERLGVVQLVEHGARVAGPMLRIARRRPEHQLVELGRDAGVHAARGGHGVVGVLIRDLHGLLADGTAARR